MASNDDRKYAGIPSLVRQERVYATLNDLLMTTGPLKWMEEKGGFWEIIKPCYAIGMFGWNAGVHFVSALVPLVWTVLQVLGALVRLFAAGVEAFFAGPITALIEAVISLIQRLSPLMRGITAWIVSVFIRWWQWAVFCWHAAKTSRHPALWLLAGLGGAVGFSSVLFLGTMMQAIGWLLGGLVCILAFAWMNAEIAALRLHQEGRSLAGESETVTPREALGRLAHGRTSVLALLVYVVVVALGIISQVVLDSTGAVPKVGPTFLGLWVLPDVAASLAILACLPVLLFGTTLVPVHLLFHDMSGMTMKERLISVPRELLGVVRKTLLPQVASALPISVLIGLYAALSSIIVGLAVSLSMAIFGVTADMVGPELLQSMGSVTASLMGQTDILTAGLGGALLASLGIGTLIAIALAPGLAAAASINYALYQKVMHNPGADGGSCYPLYLGDDDARREEIVGAMAERASAVAVAASGVAVRVKDEAVDRVSTVRSDVEAAVDEGVKKGKEPWAGKTEKPTTEPLFSPEPATTRASADDDDLELEPDEE